MHPYDELYMGDVAEAQSDIFYMIRDELPGVDERWFVEKFMRSHMRAMLDDGNPRYLNMPAPEMLLHFIEDECDNTYQNGEEWWGMLPAWAGFAYSYYQWYYNVLSKDLIERITLEDMERCYGALHQCGWEAAIVKLHDNVWEAA